MVNTNKERNQEDYTKSPEIPERGLSLERLDKIARRYADKEMDGIKSTAGKR